jgi:hypothetical protein
MEAAGRVGRLAVSVIAARPPMRSLLLVLILGGRHGWLGPIKRAPGAGHGFN